jgi:iron complex outermembrane receptor protein
LKAVPEKSQRKHQLILTASLLFLFVVLFPCFVGALSQSREERTLSELQIEDLMGLKVDTVYGASKFEQKVTQAPSAISIVTSGDIKRFGYRTLADILRSQRGFYITNDRNYHNVGIRGLSRPGDYNTRILLLVNGHRTNDNIYNQVMLGKEFILDVDLIDRIEIIRGPGSSLYGSNAFFGTINVITKRGRDVGGMEVATSAGSWDSYSGRATFGETFSNGLEMLVSATGYSSKGQNFHFTNPEFDTPENNDGWADHSDKEEAASFFAKASYKHLSLESAYVSREKWIPTASWGTVFNSGQDKTMDKRGYLNLTYNKTLENSLDVLARLYYDFYRFDGYYLFDYPPLTQNRDHTAGNWWGAQMMLTKRWGERQVFTLGGDYENSTRQLQENHDRFPPYTYLHDNRSSEIAGLYLQDEITLADNLALSAGLRYDHYTTFGSSTNPRLALIYTPFSMTVIKTLYGQAFRAPNTYELYYTDGSTSRANPSLKPGKDYYL